MRPLPTISWLLLGSLLGLMPGSPAQAQAARPLGAQVPPLSPALAERLRNADPQAGAAYFERRCAPCHDAVQDGGHGKGPLLWNVVGRPAASIGGFAFSPAMQAVKQTWDYAALDVYLKDTEAAVPGREMAFVGIADDRQRANVIAYLRTRADTPRPLP